MALAALRNSFLLFNLRAIITITSIYFLRLNIQHPEEINPFDAT